MFYDNLVAECKRQNTSMSPILKELGISTGSLGPWKRGGSVNSDVLLKLSERLGVTTDYLLKGVKSDANNAMYCVTKEEEAMLAMYRELPTMNREFIYDAIKAAYNREQAERKETARLSG